LYSILKRIVTGLVASAVIAFAVTVTGCKEDTIIKSELIPGEDKINVLAIPDTLTMTAETVIIDTLNTSANIANQPVVHGAGTVKDPVLGTTTAGIYFQVLPPANQYTFPGTVDSAFLILPYSGFMWGDTLATSVQTLTVHRTQPVLDKGTTYLSNTVIETNEQISNPFSFDPRKLEEKVPVLGANREMHLRIPLILGQWFNELRDQSQFKSTSAEFINLLRGLYVKPDPNSNSSVLPYFFLDGINDYERAAIQFFYKTDSVRSVFFSFVRGECAHSNYITRSSGLQGLINTENAKGEKLYLQNEPGAAIDIKMPYIKNLPVGIINRGILEISQITVGNDDYDRKYSAPNRLVPYVVANGTVTLADEASGTLGGIRETYSLGGGIELARYRINIGSTLQKAITGKWDMLHLRITGAKGFPAAYRLVAGGRNHPNPVLRTQLRIFYSKPQ
jgi:hypothetical protein